MWSSKSDGVGQPELVGHQDRVGHLVELRPERVGRDLAVDQAVPRERAVGQLLALEQEERRVARRGEVAGRDEAGPGLVQVASEDLAIGPEVGVVRVAGRHRLAPRRGEAGHDRARERLVLRGLDHVGAQVVGVLQLLPLGGADGQLLDARVRQRRVVRVPAGLVGIEGARRSRPPATLPPCRSPRRRSPRSRGRARSCRCRRGPAAPSRRHCPRGRRDGSASARASRRAARCRRSPSRRTRRKPRRTGRRARRRPAGRSRGWRRWWPSPGRRPRGSGGRSCRRRLPCPPRHCPRRRRRCRSRSDRSARTAAARLLLGLGLGVNASRIRTAFRLGSVT